MALLPAEHLAILEQYKKNNRKEHIVHLKEIKGLLDTIFGAECNQITELNINEAGDARIPVINYMQTLVSRKDRAHFQMTIHYPEFVITNGKLKHTIKDLYVRFQLKADLKFMPATFSGMRTTFTNQEMLATYTHSHLSGICTEFSTFCTGTGPIKMLMLTLASGYNSNTFKMFLHSLNNYVRWESLTGTPYRYIKNIGNNAPIHTIEFDREEKTTLINTCFNFVIQNHKLLKYNLTETKVGIELTDEFELKFAEYLTQHQNNEILRELFGFRDINNITPFKSSTGVYTTVQPNTPHNRNTTTPILEFKGIQKYLNITNDSAATSTSKRYPHPGISGPIIEQFSELITKKAFGQQAAA